MMNTERRAAMTRQTRRVASSVMVVSDNPELTSWFQSEIERREASEPPRIEYRYSAVNREPAPMVALGATAFDAKDSASVAEVVAHFDLVISLHCKQIFPAELVSSVTCVNVHPGLNPFNRGWYPQVFSIINGLPAGATIHVMDAEVDNGDIIDQEGVDVLPSDTSLEVYTRVVELEKRLIARNLDDLFTLSFHRHQPVGEGNYNGIRDFRALCRLDLDNVGTLGAHLNLLRALSHGEFRNAHFVDKGTKYFVRVTIERGAD